ncbi:MAG: RnfABCDGE type electron transport complex subunit B [Acholeplasmataceae bacterium]
MLVALLQIGAIGLILGISIGVASKYFEVKTDPMVQKVYDVLPHFNCGACGTPGCMAMAEAVVNENYPVTKCRPGTDQMKKGVQKMLDDYKSGVLTFEEQK